MTVNGLPDLNNHCYVHVVKNDLRNSEWKLFKIVLESLKSLIRLFEPIHVMYVEITLFLLLPLRNFHFKQNI